jgi:hypothetical protein
MISDPTKILFSTRYNFQKIYMEGTVDVLISGSTAALYTLATHSLGYIPTARVFYIPVSGQLWPLSPNQYTLNDGGTGTQLSIFGSPVLTTSALKVRMKNVGADATKTFYYRIYLDE